MSHKGFVVPARKKADIVSLANQVRNVFSKVITREGRLPIDVVYELMPEFLPKFELEVTEIWELGDDHGRTYPDKRLIQLRKDVYEGMCQGKGRDRFTGAHELGHLFLHTNIPFARALNDATDKIYCSSEWQANTFASALLMDKESLSNCRCIEEVVNRFGVTQQAAEVRFKDSQKENKTRNGFNTSRF